MATNATCGSGGVWPRNRRCLLDLLIHARHAQADGSAAARCSRMIERGVDAEGVGLEIGILKLGLQRVVHHIDEVGRFDRLRRALGHGQPGRYVRRARDRGR